MRGLFIGVLTVALLGCVGPFSEDFESQYPDVDAARADDAFGRGWLPEITPDDSIAIREMHNIDTNLTWGCFVSPSGTEKVRKKLKGLKASQSQGPVGSGPRGLFGVRDSWPRSMTTTAIETYRFDEAGARFTVIVGLDSERKTACFHRTLRVT